MTSSESRAQEEARLREAAIRLVSEMIDMRGGTGFAMAERMVSVLRDLARTLLEPVEKERDEFGKLADHRWQQYVAAMKLQREAREENTRLREQLDALKSDEWLKLATVDLQHFRIDEDRGELALEILCKHRFTAQGRD